MKRFVSISLPHWPTDRWRRRNKPLTPLVLVAPGAGGVLIAAVDQAAAARGLFIGQSLADARALFPTLHAADADAEGDRAALSQLADWCSRYTPWAAPDGEDGLTLDITGCAHLFGGEAALMRDLLDRLAGFGLAARAAAAATPAAAWAMARFGGAGSDAGFGAGFAQALVLDPAQFRATLAALPVEALRLSGDLAVQLRRLGLRTIGDVVAMPRAPLAARFGGEPLRRLDRMFGGAGEPISPRRPPVRWQARMTFAEGIGRREDIDAAVHRLLEVLCAKLAKAGRGARALELACYRLDGAVQTIDIGTVRPSHDVAHLMRLFAETLATIAPGFGIETIILRAMVTEPVALHQADLAADGQQAEPDLAAVIDRLSNRLGAAHVTRWAPRESHRPERAMVRVPGLQKLNKLSWRPQPPRPLHLLAPPEPIEARGPADGPPRDFRWRRSDYRISRAEGPERIEAEWWRQGGGAGRDYFWVEDSAGRRFWIYRTRGGEDGWYLHGLFA